MYILMVGRRLGGRWSVEEHQTFLLGLAKLRKGDWKGISRQYVKTKTPKQVASHAMKYFLYRKRVSDKVLSLVSWYEDFPEIIWISSPLSLSFNLVNWLYIIFLYIEHDRLGAATTCQVILLQVLIPRQVFSWFLLDFTTHFRLFLRLQRKIIKVRKAYG